jgi:hypothetical protein
MAARNAGWVLPSLGTLALALSIGGCRGTPQPVARTAPPEQKAPAAPSPQELPSATNHSVPSQDVVAGKEHTAVPAVVVDAGTEEGGPPPSLIEASKAEKERRAGSAKAGTVINDKTLPRYASKGQITVMAPPKDKKKGTAGKAGAAAPVPPVDVHDEAYWRGRGLEIRQRWRQLADEVKQLEQKSTELRQKFYMENDLFVRDNRIKPDWDRVLDRLRQTRLDAEAARQELSDFLEEGRRAGVLPGWLRDGEDDEPGQASGKGAQTKEQSKGRDGLPPAQSIEPPILDDKEQSRRPPPARGETRDNHKDNKLKNPRNAGDPADGDGR